MKTFNAAHWLMNHNIEDRPAKEALFCAGKSITYREIWQYSNRFAYLLKEWGLKPGERIAIVMNDCFSYYLVFLGSMLYGALPVLISTLLSREEYQFILNDLEVSALITSPDLTAGFADTKFLKHKATVNEGLFREMLSNLDEEYKPFDSREDDIAFLLCSSGSTGHPKGVPHRHRDIPFTVDAYAKPILNISEKDRVYSSSKLFFAYGLGNSLTFPLSVGASVVLFSQRPSPMDVMQIISEYKPTLYFGVPSMYNMLIKYIESPDSLSSLRMCLPAGEALPASIFNEWKALTGLEIIDSYGSTETLHICISNRQGQAIPGASGKILQPYEARLVDDIGESVPSGTEGHLLVRGQSVAPYYWNRPDKTTETMLEGGWFRTGDVFIEDNGVYLHQGRSDDMFKVDAQWVSPVQIEDVLRTHPAELDCAVTHRRLENLTKPSAFIVLKEGNLRDEVLQFDLRLHLLERLPSYMCPVEFNFCDSIPRTSTGKTQRFKLREALNPS